MAPRHRAKQPATWKRGVLGLSVSAALVLTSLGGAAFAATAGDPQSGDAEPLVAAESLDSADLAAEAVAEGETPEPVEPEEATGTEEESPEGEAPETDETGAPVEETDEGDESQADVADEPDLGGASADLASHSAAAERAGAEVPGCHYAPDGTGTYAGSLCWLSFPGLTTQVNRNPDGTYTSLMGAEYSQYISEVHEVVTNLETTRWDADASKWVTDKEVIRGFFGDITNYPVTIPLQGGLTLTAKLDVIGSAGNTMADDPVNNANKWRSQVLKATQFPTFANSFLGNQINGQNFYYPVEGSPALYQRGNNITRAQYNDATGNTGGDNIPRVSALSTVTLKDIVILDVNGNAVPEFAVVVADAESTDAEAGWSEDTSKYQEYIKWNTDGAFTWLPNNQILNGTEKERFVGNSCGASTSPAFDATVATNAKNASCYAAVMNVLKTGTAMLAAHRPTYVQQEMLGGGLEGVAFGLMFATVETTVTVTDRIVDGSGQPEGGAFTADAESGALAAGTGEATTGSLANNDTDNNFGTSGVAAMPVPPNGTLVTFEAPESANYTRSWSCTLTGRGTEPLSETFGDVPSPNIAGWLTDAQGGPNVKVGEKLKCDVTYTPQYLSLVKTVDNGSTGGVAEPADWNLTATGATATGATSVISGAGNSAESVTKRPVAVGEYDLTEVAAGVSGYDWTDLSCTTDAQAVLNKTEVNGVVTGGTVNIPKVKGGATTCTFTNTAMMPKLTLVKEIDGVLQTDVAVKDWTLTAEGPTAGITGVTTDDAVTNADAKVGRYDLSEELADSKEGFLPGFDLTDLRCVDNGGPVEFTGSTTSVDNPSVDLALGNDVTCTFTNTPKPGSVTWHKIDGATKDGLAGSEWLLKGPGMGDDGMALSSETCAPAVADSACTYTAKGRFKVSNLGWGDYVLTETKAPAGYVLDDTEHEFTITPVDGVVNLDKVLGDIENHQQGVPTLPNTGGRSAAFFTLLGLVIVGGGGAAAVYVNKRRNA